MSTPSDPVSVPLTTVGGSSTSPQGMTHVTSMVEENFRDRYFIEMERDKIAGVFIPCCQITCLHRPV
jgi:hypothetical protein